MRQKKREKLERMCGSGGEQDEANRGVMDGSFRDSPGSSFFLTQQEPGPVLTQQKQLPANL